MKQSKVKDYRPNYPKKLLKGAILTTAAAVALAGTTGCDMIRTGGEPLPPTPEQLVTDGVPTLPPTQEPLLTTGEPTLPPTEEPVIPGTPGAIEEPLTPTPPAIMGTPGPISEP